MFSRLFARSRFAQVSMSHGSPSSSSTVRSSEKAGAIPDLVARFETRGGEYTSDMRRSPIGFATYMMCRV